jgi:hypothetical protein
MIKLLLSGVCVPLVNKIERKAMRYYVYIFVECQVVKCQVVERHTYYRKQHNVKNHVVKHSTYKMLNILGTKGRNYNMSNIIIIVVPD